MKGGRELCGHVGGNIPDRGDSKGKGPRMGVCWHVLQMAVSSSSSPSKVHNAYFVPEIIPHAFHVLTLLSCIDS